MMSSDTYGRQSPPPHNHYERYENNGNVGGGVEGRRG